VAGAEVSDIDSAEMSRLQREGVALIDVRTSQEWFDTGIVPGSTLLTFFDQQGEYNIETWLERLEKVISFKDSFMLICDVGVRTEAISRVLSNQLQFPLVYNVKGGIRSWIKAGGQPVAPPMVIELTE